MAARVSGSGEVAAALAKVLGPSPMGRRPAGADKRVTGGYDQLGWSPPLCPSLRSQLISHLPQEALPDSLQDWDGGPHHGVSLHTATPFIGCRFHDRHPAKRFLCINSLNSPDTL